MGIISAVLTLVLSLATMQPAGRMADDAAMPALADADDATVSPDAATADAAGVADVPATEGDPAPAGAEDVGPDAAALPDAASQVSAELAAEPTNSAPDETAPPSNTLTELDPVVTPPAPETAAVATPGSSEAAGAPQAPTPGVTAPPEQDLPDAPSANATESAPRPDALELARAPEAPDPLPGVPVLDIPRDAAPARGESGAVALPTPEAVPQTDTTAPAALDLPVPADPVSRLDPPVLTDAFAPLALQLPGPDPILPLQAAGDLPRPRDEAQPRAGQTTPAPAPEPESEPEPEPGPAEAAPPSGDEGARADGPSPAEPAEAGEPSGPVSAPQVQTDPPGGFAESGENPAPVVRAPVASVSSGRVGLGLPQVSSFGIDDTPGSQTVPAADAPAASVEAADPAADLPALERFAAEFDADETRPLLAVLLVAEPGVPVDLTGLADLPLPVSVALDPRAPESAAAARDLRAAGAETLVYLAGQVGPDMALAPALAAMPESVAFLDGPDAALQSDRDALDVVLAQMRESGHGLVAYPRGFNTAERSASRDGLRAITLFRDLEGLSDAEMRRVLDRAGVAAGVEGAVVVTAPLRAEVVSSLVSWSLGDRSDAVALAPVSAALLRR